MQSRRGLIAIAWIIVVAAAAALAWRGTPDAVADALDHRPSTEVEAVPAGTIEFTVEPGMGAADIAAALGDRGAVRDIEQFRLLLSLTGAGAELRAGCYVFDVGTPSAEALFRLREGLTYQSLLAIPEGRRLEEIEELVAAAGLADGATWRQALETVRQEEEQRGLWEGGSYLGYLLPASYPMACEDDAAALVRAMRAAFDEQVTPELRAAAERRGMTLQEVITLASIVEREAVLKEEQPIIASVFLNRLAQGMPLQADPTVQFAIAETDPTDDGWWRRELTIDDLAFDSPYNTYLYAGLPPGPIANPGIDAIRAVIEPAETDYLYFVVSGADGAHVFASTFEEHEANVARYRAEQGG